MHKLEIQQFQKKILSWYADNKRDLPRRDTFDPYTVLVSETMLQQTQVDRVVPKFLAWMERLPTIQDLAEVDKHTLLSLWSGLGFNSRAVRLQQATKMIVERPPAPVPLPNPPQPPFNKGGDAQLDISGIIDFPHTREEWLVLPGVGPYTSAAMLAFSFNFEVPVVDTNIRRVLIWELWLNEYIGLKELEEIALSCVPKGKSNDWHNALMDYGSLVATAKVTGIKPLSKQSKFEGSPRQTRGRILKYLLEHEQATEEALKKKFPHEKFDEILVGMVRDGIIWFQSDIVRIA